jgi:predicted dehydrogenase
VGIRVAVAGLGVRGRQWAEAVRVHPACELAACVDEDRAAVDRIGADLELPAQRRFTNLADAIEAGVDAAIVATPAGAHVEPSELALSSDVAVLVEKPFTLQLADAVRLVALAEERGITLMVGQQYRYLRYMRTVRRLLADGAIGPVGMVVAHYYHEHGHVSPSSAAMENSILWGPTVHHIDALRYVFGQPITGVVADLFGNPWTPLPPGTAVQAMLTLEGGVRAQYSATYESYGHERFERGQEFYERFVGERGTLHVLHRWLVLCRSGRLPRWISRGRRPVTEEAILLDQLRRAIGDDEKPEVGGRDNLETLAALEACRRSSDERRWVDPRELLAEAWREAGAG